MINTKNPEASLTRQQFIRYLVGGASTAILNWFLIYILVEYAHLHYMISVNVAVFGVYLYSYSINKFFVFKDRTKTHVKKGSGFIIMRGGLLVVGNLLMFIGVDWFEIQYLITNILVSSWDAVASFLIMKFFVFTDEEEKKISS